MPGQKQHIEAEAPLLEIWDPIVKKTTFDFPVTKQLREKGLGRAVGTYAYMCVEGCFV